MLYTDEGDDDEPIFMITIVSHDSSRLLSEWDGELFSTRIEHRVAAEATTTTTTWSSNNYLYAAQLAICDWLRVWLMSKCIIQLYQPMDVS